jgi:Secretion system C-terminal sorting domain
MMISLLPNLNAQVCCPTPNLCAPEAAFTTTFNGCNVTLTPTFVFVNPSQPPAFTWQVDNCPISPPFIALVSGTTPVLTTTLTGSGPWVVKLTVQIGNGAKWSCCQQIDACGTVNPPVCNITATPTIACSELIIKLFSTNFPANAIHSFTFPGLKDDNGNTLSAPNISNAEVANTTNNGYLQHIQNVNTYNLTQTIIHSVLIPPATVPQTCTLTVNFPQNFPTFQGVFIGKHCDTEKTISQVAGPNLLLPAGTNNSSISGIKDVYILGDLNFSSNYTFINTNIYPGPNSTLRVRRKNGQSGPQIAVLTISDQTIIQPTSECACRWRGIEVLENARFASNVPTSTRRNIINDALYAVRPLREPNIIGSQPQISLNQTDFNRNFIGLRATDGNYTLGQFNGVVMTGNGLGKSFCNYTCPMTNDLEDQYLFHQNQGYAGILQIGVPLNIQNSTTASNTNLFNKLAVGILIDNANATIRRSRFTNIERFEYDDPGGSCAVRNSGFGIRFLDGVGNRILSQTGLDGTALPQGTPASATNSTFFNVEHGIYAGSAAFNTRAFVSNNIMGNVQRGISFVSPDDTDNNAVTAGNISIARANNNYIVVDKFFNYDGTLTTAPYCNGTFGIAAFDGNIEATRVTIENNGVHVNNSKPETGVGLWISGNMNADFGNDPEVNPQTTSIIQNNYDVTIERGQDGIRMDYVNASLILKNQVYLTENVPDVTDFTVFGIRVTGGMDHQTLCNNVRDAIDEKNKDIGLIADGTLSSYYHYNNISDTEIGSNFLNACDNTSFGCNTHDGVMELGLAYNATATTGPQFHTGNRWIGTFNNGYGTSAENSNTSATLASLFTVNPMNPDLAPPPNIQPAFWFSNDLTGPSKWPDEFKCSCEPRIIGKEVKITEGDIKLASGEFINPSKAIQFHSDYGLYTKLMQHPDLAQGDASIANFLNIQTEAPLGKLFEIEKGIHKIFSVDPSISAEIADKTAVLDNTLTQIEAISLLLEINPLEVDYLNTKEQLDDKIEVVSTELSQIFKQLADVRASNASSWISLNEEISTNTLFEENEKSLNRIYLNTFAKNQAFIPSTDKEIIQKIAYQCPEEGGPAVYRARALWQLITHVPVNVTCNATGNREESNTKPLNLLTAQITPNPADKQIQLSWNANLVKGALKVSITDNTGKVVRLMTNVDSAQGYTVINTHTLNSGLYYVAIIDGTGSLLVSNKIQIIH